MKTRTLSAIASVVALFLAAAYSADAQPKPQEDWKERMESVKIAFLTKEIGLTPTEAQSFWPIYNAVSKELDKAIYSTFSSYMELEKAVNENKSEKEISKNLERYLEAMGSQDEIRKESVLKYRKILPDSKVAKIFIAEEKFRRQNIMMLQVGPGARPQN